VIFTSARLALKQHRFELAAAAITAFVLGVAALAVNAHLRSIDVPAECLRIWRDTFDAPEGCMASLNAFGTVEEGEAGRVLAAMAVAPFLIGLLCGVPIVGRELEARTAQVAWSITGSRSRWLIRQALPVATVLALAIVFAALAADILESTRQLKSHSAVNDMTLHGWPVVGRAYAAFGVGLLLGALTGRTLPAFVLGAVISLALVGLLEEARTTSVMRLTPVPVEVGSDGSPGWVGASFGVVWFTPDGLQISDVEANARVPPESPDFNQWLIDHGYRRAELVISEQTVLGWRFYDFFAFTALGTTALTAAFVVVTRRRPTP
jgi:hypothetical protein